MYYSCTKNEVHVMQKFRKHGGKEPPRKLCKLCDFTCLTSGDLRFLQNTEHSGIKSPQEFTSHLSCVLKNYINRKHLDIFKTFECYNSDFSAKSKDGLRNHEHLKHKTKPP